METNWSVTVKILGLKFEFYHLQKEGQELNFLNAIALFYVFIILLPIAIAACFVLWVGRILLSLKLPFSIYLVT